MTIVKIAMWETRHSIADWVIIKTQTLLATLRTLSQPQEVSCVFLEVEHFVPGSCMCKKQTSVSHSSTGSEVISLDAGQRMDGLPALDLWDMVIEVLDSIKDKTQPKHTRHPETGVVTSHQETEVVLDSKTKTQRRITYPPTHVLLTINLRSTSLKTMRL